MKFISKDRNYTELQSSNNETDSGIKNRNNLYFSFIPVMVVLFAIIGFTGDSGITKKSGSSKIYTETKGGEIKNAGKFNILSSEDLNTNLKDTVYTKKDTWLELRIDQQMLYQHWRDGRVEKYPVSSGNNKGGDPEALESRPGLFAIFHKEEHHQSTQFNSSNMYHFMPFNQGIGFHSIDGTGYYAHLGVRPSSHGCIRMKHSDAEKLFKETPLGTLVLATKGYSARTVAFAPKDFENRKEYTKEEYKIMLAGNLYNLLSGRYYIEEREKFVVDPKIIPVSGVYISYDVKIPSKQIIPRSFVTYYDRNDKSDVVMTGEILLDPEIDETIKMVDNEVNENTKVSEQKNVNSTGTLIKEYFNNPIGVLPYFGPKR
ncbi:MAG: L,D-transpeptidase [Ignavibacteria bacterium]|nr:L,D-transpeptidase [Ignavibacteria bacterium]